MLGSRIQRLASLRRKRRTYSEQKLENALNNVRNGQLRGEFVREWAIGRWRLDFFFPMARLGVEVDGPYHENENQQNRDRQKKFFLKKHDIYLLRFTNGEVNRASDAVATKIAVLYDARIANKK